jgi:chromosome partitioning protein
VTKIIALFNQSGGVGKTSLTMNLGYQLAQRDLKVLLVDMDPQSSLTSFLGLDIYQLDKTIYQSITQYESLPIHHNIHGMDLVLTFPVKYEFEQEASPDKVRVN